MNAILRAVRAALLFCSPLALLSCAHDPITKPEGPGGSVIGVTSTGLIFTQSGHDLWLREGVPASYFTEVQPKKWYISEINWHAGNAIRLKKVNP